MLDIGNLLSMSHDARIVSHDGPRDRTPVRAGSSSPVCAQSGATLGRRRGDNREKLPCARISGSGVSV